MKEWLALVFSHPDLKGMLIVAGKTSVVYLFLVLALRVSGKRELGQMNLYDLVVIIVLANAVQNAMVGDDTTLVGGIVAAVTLLLWNRLLTLILLRSRRVERFLVGGPVLLLSHGQVIPESCRKQGVTREQLAAACREHGIDRPEKARLCVLEQDGSISVVAEDAAMLKTRHHFKTLRMP